MGSGLAIIPVVVIGLLVVVVAVMAAVARSAGGRTAEVEREHPTLRYHVPEGVDPAALVAALDHEGFRASTTPGSLGEDLVIACPRGTDQDRDRVRATIQHAYDLQGDPISQPPVRFDDELGRAGS